MAEEKQVVEKKEPSTLSSSLGIDLNSMPKFKNKEAQESFLEILMLEQKFLNQKQI